MQATPGPQQALVKAYLALRRGIGIIGITLPLVLVAGRMILESLGIMDSISAYYYSVMRDVFVGSLCAVAVFLFAYRYELRDDIVSSLAGIFAVGVVFFPTTPDGGATPQQVMIGQFHLFFAAAFFFALAFMVIVLFRKTNPNEQPTPQKRQRNIVYLCSGIALVACILLILALHFLPRNLWPQSLHPVFWLETLAIMAFGIAWFVKGETILQDK